MNTITVSTAAIEALLLAMLACIGILKALHRHDVREFEPSERKRFGESDSSLATADGSCALIPAVAVRP